MSLQKKCIIQSEHGWSLNTEWETWDVTEWVQRHSCKPVRLQQQHDVAKIMNINMSPWRLAGREGCIRPRHVDPTATCLDPLHIHIASCRKLTGRLVRLVVDNSHRQTTGTARSTATSSCFKGIVHSKLTPGTLVSSGFRNSLPLWNSGMFMWLRASTDNRLQSKWMKSQFWVNYTFKSPVFGLLSEGIFFIPIYDYYYLMKEIDNLSLL